MVGIISPWNYPFQLAIMPIIAALAAGNRIMLKPSELTPRTSEFLADFLGRLFPEEKVATVLGGPDVGRGLLVAALRPPVLHRLDGGGPPRHARRRRKPDARDARTRRQVALHRGARRRPCRRPPRSIAAGKLLNAGQTCIAPDYILVPEALREDLIAALQNAVTAFYPSLRANPDYTSIVNARHYGRIAKYIEEARQKGVRIVEIDPAGEAFAPQERKIAPTLLIDPPGDLAVMREEIFGPVLPIRILQDARRRHRLTSTPARARSRSIISAPARRIATACWRAPHRAAPPSTRR